MGTMLPNTIHGRSPFECTSALQKFIRRGMEREAMEMAIEMCLTSKSYFTWTCNRLDVIMHEDIGIVDVGAITFATSTIEQAKRTYKIKPEATGPWKLMLGNVIMVLCRAEKSREGDHFACACTQKMLLDGYKPEIPDWAYDCHTKQGKAKGRGIDHFRSTASQLVQPDGNVHPDHDEYVDEAYGYWKRMHNGEERRLPL